MPYVWLIEWAIPKLLMFSESRQRKHPPLSLSTNKRIPLAASHPSIDLYLCRCPPASILLSRVAAMRVWHPSGGSAMNPAPAIFAWMRTRELAFGLRPFAANKTGTEYRGGVCYFSFDAAAIFWADAAGRVGCATDRQLASSLRQEAEAFLLRRRRAAIGREGCRSLEFRRPESRRRGHFPMRQRNCRAACA